MSVERLTPENLAEVSKFREKVLPLLSKDEYKEDHYLVRWLIARDWDHAKAEEMLRDSLKWREEYGVDGILEREEFPEAFSKKFMFAIIGEDEEGCPVLLFPGGRHDTRALVEEYGVDQVYRWNVMRMERLMQIIADARAKTGKQVFQFTEIFDLEGYSIRQVTHGPTMECMRKVMDMFEGNYPEVVKMMLMINSPRIFPIVFNIFKPLLTKHMLEKMNVLGNKEGEWVGVFKERGFPMDRIPKRWGGSFEGEDEFASTSDLWECAPIPLRYFREVEGEDEEGFMTMKVAAREKMKLEIEIEEKGVKLEWKFQTQGHDIAFGIEFELPGAVDIPVRRVDSHKEMQEGKIIAQGKGKCVFTFDNRYSLSTAKSVRYKIDLIVPTKK